MRISDDKAGEGAGVARQEADCRALIERHGWTVAEVYLENDTSEFKRKRVTLPDGSSAMRVVRPAFRQMLDDLASGAADALVAYDLDRIARDPRDLEDLIDVVERRQVPTRTVTGSLDLSTDAGITMSRVLLAMANKSSRDTARRVTRKHLDLAEQGKVGGGGIRGFGYQRDGLTVDESEAEVLRDVAAAILEGQSLKSIAKSLDARGVPTVRGGPWNARSVHSAVSKARVAGLREHRGEIVGKAVWPAILDEDTWTRVRLALEGRSQGSTNRLVRWLTSILVCSSCGQPLPGGTGNAGPRYWCKDGCGQIAVSALRAEATVEQIILAYLARPDIADGLQTATSAKSVDHARADLAADETQLAELAQMWAARTISTKEYMAARTAIEARMAASKTLVRAALPGTVRNLLGADDLEGAWTNLTVPAKREVAHIVFPDGIRVEPRREHAGFRGYDPTRLVPIGWTQP